MNYLIVLKPFEHNIFYIRLLPSFSFPLTHFKDSPIEDSYKIFNMFLLLS